MEQQEDLHEGPGYRIHRHELRLEQIGLKWGTYSNEAEKVIRIQPKKASIVSHYRLVDETRDELFGEKQFVIFREAQEAYEIRLSPTKDKPRKYFELSLDEDFFYELGTTDSRFLDRFHRYSAVETSHYDFIAGMTTAMKGVIADIQQTPFTGKLQEVWLESKAMELFLLQVKQLDMPWSIAALARKAGINQQKLKTGFLALFGTTVFGHLIDVRMREARRMLEDEKLYVGEVAERLGYKHPHHFTAAFRKKFNVLPGELRR